MGLYIRWCRTGDAVVVAPGQFLLTLALCVVRQAGGVTRSEEGAPLGGDEGGVSRGDGGLQDGAAADAGICVVVLETMKI